MSVQQVARGDEGRVPRGDIQVLQPDVSVVGKMVLKVKQEDYLFDTITVDYTIRVRLYVLDAPSLWSPGRCKGLLGVT